MPDFILANGRTLVVAGEGNNRIGKGQTMTPAAYADLDNASTEVYKEFISYYPSHRKTLLTIRP
jgi:hypothetical protein